GSFHADADVFVNGQVGQNLGDLKCAHDALGDALDDRLLGDRLAFEDDLAGSRRQKAADQVEDRVLAGSIWANAGPQFSRRHVERDSVDRFQRAEVPRYVVET